MLDRVINVSKVTNYRCPTYSSYSCNEKIGVIFSFIFRQHQIKKSENFLSDVSGQIEKLDIYVYGRKETVRDEDGKFLCTIE